MDDRFMTHFQANSTYGDGQFWAYHHSFIGVFIKKIPAAHLKSIFCSVCNLHSPALDGLAFYFLFKQQHAQQVVWVNQLYMIYINKGGKQPCLLTDLCKHLEKENIFSNRVCVSLFTDKTICQNTWLGFWQWVMGISHQLQDPTPEPKIYCSSVFLCVLHPPQH